MSENLYIKSKIEAEAYDGIVKARMQTESRIDNMVRDHKISLELSEELHQNLDKELKKTENYLLKQMTKTIQDIPIYTEFLESVHGMGPRLTTKLIAHVEDINRFPKISMLWKYAGMAPVTYCTNCKTLKRYFKTEEEANAWIERTVLKQTRNIPENDPQLQAKIDKITNAIENSVCRCENPTPIIKAEKRVVGIASVDYNPKFKKLMFLISEQFVRQGIFYRDLFDKIKEEETAKNGEILSKGHIHNRTKRKVAKIFLSHLWQVWRELEGLDVTKPYASDILGHTMIAVPKPDEDGRI